MSEKAVFDDLVALNLKNSLARREPWWRLVSLGHTPCGMTNIFSLATPLIVATVGHVNSAIHFSWHKPSFDRLHKTDSISCFATFIITILFQRIYIL